MEGTLFIHGYRQVLGALPLFLISGLSSACRAKYYHWDGKLSRQAGQP